MELIEAIEGRRSIGRVRPDEPSREEIETLLRAAVKAPNHRNNQPWRFVVVAGKAREGLGTAMGEGLRARLRDVEPDKATVLVDAESAKPLRAPILIVVASKHTDDERIHPLEDMQACCAAIQNMLLAAHDKGLAAQWRTGGAVNDAAVKEHLGLDLRDEIAGFVYVGYPQDGYEASPRPREYAQFTEWRSS